MRLGTKAWRPIEGVKIVSDFLRPDAQGRPAGVDPAAGWLFTAVRRQIALASGLPVARLMPSASPELAQWVMAVYQTASPDGVWTDAFADLARHPEWDDAIESLVLAPLRGQFCVGYEMPPYLVRLLDHHMIPYIDIRLHPVRFMDDLLFAVRASSDETQAALGEIACAETDVIATAALREAMCQLISETSLPASTLLVLGQRPRDASQIADGGFFDAMDHAAEIAAICARYPALLLKPHPHDPEHSLLTIAAGFATTLGITKDNIYRLLAMPEIAAILTVSSSAAYEARYFGKTVFTLAEPPVSLAWRGEAIRPEAHVSLNDTVLSVDFWRIVLAPYCSVTATDGVRLAPKPNRLRIAMDSFWGYNEIDTDLVPTRSP